MPMCDTILACGHGPTGLLPSSKTGTDVSIGEFLLHVDPPPDGAVDVYLVRVLSDGRVRFVRIGVSEAQMSTLTDEWAWTRYFLPAVMALQENT